MTDVTDELYTKEEYTDLALLCIEKNRHGEAFKKLKMNFNPERARFEELDNAITEGNWIDPSTKNESLEVKGNGLQ